MEPVSALSAAGLVVLGFVLGRIKRTKADDQPMLDPTKCAGCRHGLSYRDPDTGQCTALVAQPTRHDGDGKPVDFKQVQCTCRNHASHEMLLLDPMWSKRPPLLGDETR